MVHTSLTPRRILAAAGLVFIAGLAGCSTVPSSSTSVASTDAALQSKGPAARNSETRAEPAADSVYERRIRAYESNPENALSHVRRLGYVDALLHVNRPRKAIDVLISTEIAFPGAYMNALYLGLSYEMLGDLKSARHWVAQTIERNPDARGGSEWLHLAMIEARLALAQDPKWLEKNSVLAKNTWRTAEDILSAIRIQLAVRGDFGLSPDLVVCDLYFEAGICAPSLVARQEYFAQSLELGTLRMGEIERHERIRARAHASVQAH